jgi:hypothetical protein
MQLDKQLTASPFVNGTSSGVAKKSSLALYGRLSVMNSLRAGLPSVSLI